MKKVFLTIGGTQYEVHFTIQKFGTKGRYITIESIFSTIQNCMSILGYSEIDIENKVISVLSQATDI
jgi:hypothetical protein